MVARLLSLAVVLGALNLVSLGLSTLSAAQAASVNGSAPPAVVKRPLFRPVGRASERIGSSRQPMSAARINRGSTAVASHLSSVSRAQRRAQDAMVFNPRAGARKAVPVTRGQELGLRFRPDENAAPYSQPARTVLQPGGLSTEDQSQFRPLAPKRKPTYEELQAESAPAARTPPAMPYPPPIPAPLMPGFGGPWPRF